MVEDHPLARAGVRGITPYMDRPRSGVNLANNASLHPPGPAVEAELMRLTRFDLRAYPERTSRPLREALGRALGVVPDGIVTGNGSNDVIDLAIRAFTEPGSTVAYTPPTFEMFPRAIATNGATAVPVPLGDAFRLPVDALVEANARLTLVASPNNPTGNAFPVRAIEAVADGVDGLVLVDEAYVEFHDEDALGLLARGDVLVTRTFSKAYGLAACRVGYAVAPPAIASALSKVRGPFRLNPISERLATAALADAEHLAGVVADVKAQRARMHAAARRLGLTPIESAANFLFARHANAALLVEAIAKRGFLVRGFGPPIQDRFRFTVGPASVNDAFLEALETSLVEVGP